MASIQAQNPSINGLSTPQSAVTNSAMNSLRRPLRTELRSPPKLPRRSVTYGGPLDHNRISNTYGQHRLLNERPRHIVAAEARPSSLRYEHPWRCVNMFCKRHRDRYVYTRCDGWKRHMKEHETVWSCMLYVSGGNADNSLICALCGSTTPDESHMAGHSIGDCGDATKLRRFSRGDNLKKHLLQSHGVSEECALRLSKEWKTTLLKKYFACGFCICVFSTIHEQLNHIDVDHFQKGQQIEDWSATFVIRGLLLSPEVASSFQDILRSDPYATDRELHWSSDVVEELQRRLEMAEDAAEILALEAYGMLTFNLNRQMPYGQQALMSLSGMEFTAQSEVAMGPFVASTESLGVSSEHRIEGLAKGSERPCYSNGYHVATPLTSYSRPTYGLPMNQSDTSEALIRMKHQNVYPMTPTSFPAVSASTTPRSEPLLFSNQTRSASTYTELSSTSGYESSVTSPHWQAAPSTIPSTLHSRDGAENSRQHPKTHEKPTPKIGAAEMMDFDLNDIAESHSLEGGSVPIDTCNPKDLIKR